MYKLPTKIGQTLAGQWCRTTIFINPAKQRVLPTIACDISDIRKYTENASIRSYDVIKSSCSDVEIPNENLPEFLFKKFSKFPERQAITCGASGRSYTYSTVQNMSIRFAKALLAIRGANLKKNDTIAILLPNIPEFPSALFGALLAGIKVTFASPLNTPEELMRQFQTANVKLVITIPPFLPLAGIFRTGLAGYRGTVCIGGNDDLNENIFSFSTMISTEHKANLPTVSPNDVAIIPFSSGTSGLPKGVQLTHQNCIANLEQLSHPIFSKYHNDAFVVENETVLTVPPFFHIFGLNGILHLSLQEGANVVTLPQFKPEDYIKALLTYRPQILFVVPTLMTFLATHPGVTKEMLSSVDQMVVGAAAASAELQEKMIAKCDSNVIILQGYGMTEMSPVSLLTPLQPLPGKTASVGMLFPNTEARIISLTTGKPVGPNERGEIHFRGPQIMKGYLGNEEATRETIDADGWLKTGDVAYFDEDGYFFIVDRTKELIKVKGYQVSPTELETLLVQLPEIADVAVGGIVDDTGDEMPRAYIVLRPNAELTAEEVQEHVKKNAAKHKWLIGGVRFVKAIPRNLSGKILRRNLLQLDKTKEV